MNKTRFIRSLTAEEIKSIKLHMKTAKDSQSRNRAQSIWLSHQGYKIDEIAKILDRHRNAIVLWFERFESQGLIGLQDQSRSGRRPRAGSEFQKTLVEAVNTPPRNLNYSFATWSAGRLRDHMTKTTGIHISEIQLRRLLKKNGIAFRKPKHDLKGKQDPALYNQKKELLEFLKKTRLPKILALSFCFWMNAIFICILT